GAIGLPDSPHPAGGGTLQRRPHIHLFRLNVRVPTETVIGHHPAIHTQPLQNDPAIRRSKVLLEPLPNRGYGGKIARCAVGPLKPEGVVDSLSGCQTLVVHAESMVPPTGQLPDRSFGGPL